MNNLNFYSDVKSKQFLSITQKRICFLGACTARNLANGISYFSNNRIAAYAPYDTIFNAPSLLKDLEIVTNNLRHKVIIDEYYHEFRDSIRFWNKSSNLNDVIDKNKIIDSNIIDSVKNADLVIVSLGSAEMWKKNGRIINRLPKSDFNSSEIENIYLSSEEVASIAKDIIKCVNSINPSAKIQFSISYIILKASERFSNLYLATTENYRILKNAIINLGEDYYFPEYELFKYYANDIRKFQEDNRHFNVELIAEVSKHIVKEVDEKLLCDIHEVPFSIKKVNNKGKVYGEEQL